MATYFSLYKCLCGQRPANTIMKFAQISRLFLNFYSIHITTTPTMSQSVEVIFVEYSVGLKKWTLMVTCFTQFCFSIYKVLRNIRTLWLISGTLENLGRKWHWAYESDANSWHFRFAIDCFLGERFPHNANRGLFINNNYVRFGNEKAIFPMVFWDVITHPCPTSVTLIQEWCEMQGTPRLYRHTTPK